MKWFGRKWTRSRVCEDTPQVPVPVGAVCSYCDEQIGVDDCGFVVPAMDSADFPSRDAAEHHECFMRQIVGSVGHQMHLCSCYGLENLSESGMTRRRAASFARDYFEKRWPTRTILK